jgi:hypothetical protein
MPRESAMKSEREEDVEHLDEEFREILIAILRSHNGACVEECVERVKHGRISSRDGYPGREGGH